MAFDHVGIPLLDDRGQPLQCCVLRFLHIFWIDNKQFFPTGVIRERNAHDVIVVAEVTPDYRENFQLHAFQFFKRQVLKQCAAGSCEIMLHRVGEGEEIAPGVPESVTQRKQFLPAIDCDQPGVLEITTEFFGFDAEIDNVAIGPHKWMERLDIGNCRSIVFPPINADRAGLAQLNGNNARRRISPEKHRVLFEFHRSTNLSVIPSEVEESLTLYCRGIKIERCFDPFGLRLRRAFAQHDKYEGSFLLNLVGINAGFGARNCATDTAITRRCGTTVTARDLQRRPHPSGIIRT